MTINAGTDPLVTSAFKPSFPNPAVWTAELIAMRKAEAAEFAKTPAGIAEDQAFDDEYSAFEVRQAGGLNEIPKTLQFKHDESKGWPYDSPNTQVLVTFIGAGEHIGHGREGTAGTPMIVFIGSEQGQADRTLNVLSASLISKLTGSYRLDAGFGYRVSAEDVSKLAEWSRDHVLASLQQSASSPAAGSVAAPYSDLRLNVLCEALDQYRESIDDEFTVVDEVRACTELLDGELARPPGKAGLALNVEDETLLAKALEKYLELLMSPASASRYANGGNWADSRAEVCATLLDQFECRMPRQMPTLTEASEATVEPAPAPRP